MRASKESIRSFMFAKFKELPITSGSHCVYVLTHDGEVVYVGQTIAIMARMGVHIRDEFKQFDRVWYLEVETGTARNVESALIKCLKPKYNTKSLYHNDSFTMREKEALCKCNLLPKPVADGLARVMQENGLSF